MNTWNGCPQRELTTNPLSGKLGADQLRFQALRRFHGLHPDFVGSAILAPALAGSTWTSTAGDESLRTARFATTSQRPLPLCWAHKRSRLRAYKRNLFSTLLRRYLTRRHTARTRLMGFNQSAPPAESG